jgi:hypothetical protein
VQGRLEARYGRGFQPRSAKSARRAERSARSADAASTGEISAGAPAATKELS